MTVEIKQIISASYTEDDIKRLIILDLQQQGLTVEPKDITVSISSGHADNSWMHYGGGHTPAQVEIVPVKFNGFFVRQESKS